MSNKDRNKNLQSVRSKHERDRLRDWTKSLNRLKGGIAENSSPYRRSSKQYSDLRDKLLNLMEGPAPEGQDFWCISDMAKSLGIEPGIMRRILRLERMPLEKISSPMPPQHIIDTCNTVKQADIIYLHPNRPKSTV